MEHHWIEKDQNNIWHPFTPLHGVGNPLLIESASGIYLKSSDGRKIIDAVSSWWVNIHGHAHPELAEALANQARVLEHVIFAGFTHHPAIQLSENLLSILPTGMEKIFFSDNGSTAVEVGIKMALQYWHNLGKPRRKIVALDGAYHGDTFGSMSVGERGIFTAPFSDHLFNVDFIDFPISEESIAQFEKRIGTGEVAAFIYEPLVQGASGMRMYSPDLLEKLLSHAKANGVICIADEVFTGFGRTGKWFASEFIAIPPDIIAISKGLTGGTMPLGVTACNARIVEAFATADILKTFFHGHSYTANPLACAVANKSFELLMRPDCKKSIERIGNQHVAFRQRIASHPSVKEVRTLGTIFALELNTTEGTSYTNDLRKRIYPYFLDKGVLLRPLGNVIYIVPPYIMKANELSFIYSCIEEFLDEIKG